MGFIACIIRIDDQLPSWDLQRPDYLEELTR